jgi:subtilisin family serine protease
MTDNNQSLENLINRIEINPLVEDVETNKLMVAHQASSQQVTPVGLDRIDGEPNGNESQFVDVDVAIMDTGIDADHPDLNVLEDKQVNFIGSTPNDRCGHGTHVAGIVGAKDNDIGIVGIAPGAKLWNVKVLEKNPSTGGCSGSLQGIIQGLNYVAENADEIDVVNLSLGGLCPANSCDSPVYEKAINRVVDNGVVVIVSAGNSNQNAKDFIPARFLSPITVSAISDTDGKCGGLGPISNHPRGGPDDTLADFSNFGSTVDVSAPGVDILSTYPNDAYAVLSGTSMSGPYVAGAAALIKAENPNISPSIVRNILLELASNVITQCNNEGYGYFKEDRDGLSEPLLHVKELNLN